MGSVHELPLACTGCRPAACSAGHACMLCCLEGLSLASHCCMPVPCAVCISCCTHVAPVCCVQCVPAGPLVAASAARANPDVCCAALCWSGRMQPSRLALLERVKKSPCGEDCYGHERAAVAVLCGHSRQGQRQAARPELDPVARTLLGLPVTPRDKMHSVPSCSRCWVVVCAAPIPCCLRID